MVFTITINVLQASISLLQSLTILNIALDMVPGIRPKSLQHSMIQVRPSPFYILCVLTRLLAAQSYVDTPRPPLPAPNTSRGRFSFPPRRSYDQPSREPRTITNADNHFRFAQNLHQNVPISQQPPPRPANSQETDTISQLATSMLQGRQVSQPRTRPEPMNYLQPLQPRQPNPLQPQMQQITPPFNLSKHCSSLKLIKR